MKRERKNMCGQEKTQEQEKGGPATKESQNNKERPTKPRQKKHRGRNLGRTHPAHVVGGRGSGGSIRSSVTGGYHFLGKSARVLGKGLAE